MKTTIINKSGAKGKEIELPKIFSVDIRPDILLKVFEAEKFVLMHPYGAMPGAGAGYSASGILQHRRNRWKTTYGKGISRVPRKIMSRHGASFNWVGATVSSARGGRKPTAPKAEKKLQRKINKKEFSIALNSAFSGTFNEKSIEKKYGKLKSGFVFTPEVLEMKTKDFFDLLKKLFGSLDKIIKKKTIRAGKGKMRGRKYKSNAGLLFVISSKENMKRKGIEVVKANELKINDLAPNGVAGRIACYTKDALDEIETIFGGKK